VTSAVRTDGRPGLAIAVLAGAQLMFVLDATIVNVTLPGIQHSLGFSGAGLEWVTTAYSLAFGGFLLLGGRAGDVLGRRRVFLVGLGVFTAASLVGGLALTQWWLVACRALQGLGAALSAPSALALITATFPLGAVRDRAIAAYATVATAGGGIGLLAGGLIGTYLSWRWVMFVNVPVGLLVLAAGPRVLAESGRTRGRFDVAGALAGTLSITLLVYGLIAGATDHTGVAHWGDPLVLAALGGSAVFIAVFVLAERRSATPLVPLRVFRDRAWTGTLVVLVLTTTATVGIFFFLTLFVQQVWHYSPLETTWVYLPLTCLMVAGVRAGRWLTARIGARRLIAGGLAVSAVGMAWLSRIGEARGYLDGMLVPTLLAYGGLGVTAVPLMSKALAGLAPEEAGLASGVLSAARQIGGAAGLAVLGTVTWAVAARGDLATGIGTGFTVAAALMAASLAVTVLALPRDRERSDR